MSGGDKEMERDAKHKFDTDEYRVGYRNPPKEHQFRRGEKSPNPSGRPRGPRKAPAINTSQQSLDDLILRGMDRLISVRKGDHFEDITIRQAIAEGLLMAAAKGDHRARREVSERCEAARKRRNDHMEELRKAAMELRIAWVRLSEHFHFYCSEWEYFPEASDIEIDPETSLPVWTSMWVEHFAARYLALAGERERSVIGAYTVRAAQRAHNLCANQKAYARAVQCDDLILALSMLRQALQETNNALTDMTPQEGRAVIVKLIGEFSRESSSSLKALPSE